ncbi:YggT family protein [Oceanicaulis sp. MMSF_3324]|uniref:YggT family protein n=1 Tax=Oceanicaulis sp. MMSF_3324 TaxID=3046702 RepID=UPI00273D3051|nr:YggT family protein [Oceanicaulis sp. MMSF_3324]
MEYMSLAQVLVYLFILIPLQLLVYVIFVGVILSWLISFNVVNPNNQLVSTIWRLTGTITEPLLRPIRNILPPLGGLDLSPLVLLLVIMFVRNWLILGQIFPRLG